MSQIYLPTTGGGGGGSQLTFVTDSGTATSSGFIINVVTPGGGTQGIKTSGAGSTVTVTLTETAGTYTNVTHAMSPYTVQPTDYFLSVDASAGAVTINLPAAPTTNQQFIIKDRLGYAATNLIRVQAFGGTTVDTMGLYDFTDNFESLEVLYHASNYEGF